MTPASAGHLRTYLADLVETLERFALTLLPPNDAEEIALGTEPDGALVIDLEARFPSSRHSRDADLQLFERWRRFDRSGLVCVDYMYELRQGELDYRRALHRHDEEWFVRRFGVATHEHCEAPMGTTKCDHFAGPPVRDAFDAFTRLCDLWLVDHQPDCSALTCLE